MKIVHKGLFSLNTFLKCQLIVEHEILLNFFFFFFLNIATNYILRLRECDFFENSTVTTKT